MSTASHHFVDQQQLVTTNSSGCYVSKLTLLQLSVRPAFKGTEISDSACSLQRLAPHNQDKSKDLNQHVHHTSSSNIPVRAVASVLAAFLAPAPASVVHAPPAQQSEHPCQHAELSEPPHQPPAAAGRQ